MKLFLDTEFNGHGGELISMAIISEYGHQWYEVRQMTTPPVDWVSEHVMPKLQKSPINANEFHESLGIFLSQFDLCEVIADWPADFEHLCNSLSEISMNSGFSIPFECTLRLIRGDDTIAPDNPHNAMSDARALRQWWLKNAAT